MLENRMKSHKLKIIIIPLLMFWMKIVFQEIYLGSANRSNLIKVEPGRSIQLQNTIENDRT